MSVPEILEYLTNITCLPQFFQHTCFSSNRPEALKSKEPDHVVSSKAEALVTTGQARSSVASTTTMYIPTEDEIEQLEHIGKFSLNLAFSFRSCTKCKNNIFISTKFHKYR